MNHSGWTMFLALGALGCGAPQEAPAGETVSREAPSQNDIAAEVAAVLDDWHAAAAAADEDRYFGHFTDGAVFLGTDATERWEAEAFRAYAHPHFAEGRAWSFRATRRGVASNSEGDIAWFDEDLATENLGPARGSGVLIRGDDDALRIAHYSLTITVPNERFSEVRDLLAAGPDDGPASEE